MHALLEDAELGTEAERAKLIGGAKKAYQKAEYSSSESAWSNGTLKKEAGEGDRLCHPLRPEHRCKDVSSVTPLLSSAVSVVTGVVSSVNLNFVNVCSL